MPASLTRLFLLPGGRQRDPAVDQWLREQPDELADIARAWFGVMRECGNDVRELLHDDQPTACVGEAAFAYVDAFSAHVNVGFFHGATLADVAGLLQGAGKHMRHVKLRPGAPLDAASLEALIAAAYRDIVRRLESLGTPVGE